MPRDSLGTVPAGFDAVEIKVTLDAEQVDQGLAAFDLQIADAERCRIWFCEHLEGYGGPATLPLFARGLILRVRSRESGAGDSTIKLRGTEGGVDPDRWHRRTRAFPEAGAD